MNLQAPLREIDPAHFRKVMGRFASGVTVVTAGVGGYARGMTANAFMSGSLEPPLCVVSVAKRAHMHAHLRAAGRFAVNILSLGQEQYAGHFSGKPVPGLEVPFIDVGGIPTLGDAAALITADLAAEHDCGDHTLYVGHILFMRSDERPPLLYHAGHYGALLPESGDDIPTPEFW